MTDLNAASKQLTIVKTQIAELSKKHHRDHRSIKLIGASKTQNAETISAFKQAGLDAVGENYLQEAINKQATLKTQEIEWHFIGGIQSNKTKEIADNFSWVHGIDRLKIAKRLSQQSAVPLNLLVQLNLDSEDSKNGVGLNNAEQLCNDIAQLDNIKLRGFMVIPKSRIGLDEQRRPFALARTTLESINQQYGLSMDTLSMGMSNDLEAAIAEGSTMVRIGTALFGARKNATKP